MDPRDEELLLLRQRIAELEKENEELKCKLQRPIDVEANSTDNIYERVHRFFKHCGISANNPAEAMLLAINVMASLYHAFDLEESDDLSQATYKAFLRAIVSIVDACESKVANKSIASFPYVWLLESFPAVTASGDKRVTHSDWLALHWFFYSSESTDDCELMLSAYCEDSLAKDFSPFTLACSRPDANLSFLEKALHAHPSLAHHRNADGSAALFHAASTSTSLEFIQWLHDKFPGAMHCTDICGLSVLNYVCFSGSDVTILDYLCTRQPELMSQSSHTKLLPLHDAAVNVNGGVAFVDYICSRSPHAISSRDDCGATPVHLACEFGSLDMVRFLVGRLEGSVYISDNEGMLPIHYASKRGRKDLALLDFLIGCNPEGRALDPRQGEGRGDIFSSIVSNLSEKLKKMKVVYDDIRFEMRNSESLRAAGAINRESLSPAKQGGGAGGEKVKLRSRHSRSSIIAGAAEAHALH